MTEREKLRADIKKRLNTYKDLRAEHRQIADELLALERLMASPSSPNLDGMPRGSAVSNPVANMVAKHIDLEERYKGQIARLVSAQEAIEDLIETLEPMERRLARFRYIDGLTWEEVCMAMCYSWRQTHRIHARILDKLVSAELEKVGQ